jgi:hypothetical protein
MAATLLPLLKQIRSVQTAKEASGLEVSIVFGLTIFVGFA